MGHGLLQATLAGRALEAVTTLVRCGVPHISFAALRLLRACVTHAPDSASVAALATPKTAVEETKADPSSQPVCASPLDRLAQLTGQLLASVLLSCPHTALTVSVTHSPADPGSYVPLNKVTALPITDGESLYATASEAVLLLRALLAEGSRTASAAAGLVAASFRRMELAGASCCCGNEDGSGVSSDFFVSLAALAALGGHRECLRVGARVELDDCCCALDGISGERSTQGTPTGVVVHYRRLGVSATVVLDEAPPPEPLEVPCTSLRVVPALLPTLGQVSGEISVLPFIKLLLQTTITTTTTTAAAAASRLAVLRSAALQALPTVVAATGAESVLESGILAPLTTLALSTVPSRGPDLDARLLAAAQVHLDLRLCALHTTAPSAPTSPADPHLPSQLSVPDVGTHALGQCSPRESSDEPLSSAMARRFATDEALGDDSTAGDKARTTTMERGLEVWSLAPPAERVDLQRNDAPYLPWGETWDSEAATSAVCDGGRSMFAGEMEGLLVRGQTHGVGSELGSHARSLGVGSVRTPVDITVPPSTSSRAHRPAANESAAEGDTWSLIDLVLELHPALEEANLRVDSWATTVGSANTSRVGRADGHRGGMQRVGGVGLGNARRDREREVEGGQRVILGKPQATPVAACSVDPVALSDARAYMPLQARPPCSSPLT
jgi:hypothetical protein